MVRPTPQLASRARAAFVGAMTDICVILAYSDAVDEVGQAVATYTPGAATACAFRPGVSSEAARDSATRRAATGELWLPLDAAVTSRDRVRLTGLWGETLADPVEFGIEGDPRRDVGRLICQLRGVAV